VTQSSSGDAKRSPLKAGMRPWEPPSLSAVLAAVESPQEDAPFVFHDPAGRRWSRIKRGAVIAAIALLVVVVGVLVAVTRVAPGRAPTLAGTPTQQVPDWQVRGSGAPPAGAVPSVAAGQSAAALAARSSPTPTPRPSPTSSRRSTPAPKRTPLPPTPIGG